MRMEENERVRGGKERREEGRMGANDGRKKGTREGKRKDS